MQSISDTVSTNVPAITFKLLLATCIWRFFSCLDFLQNRMLKLPRAGHMYGLFPLGASRPSPLAVTQQQASSLRVQDTEEVTLVVPRQGLDNLGLCVLHPIHPLR